jgi:UDP-N-acetylmuramoyl-tripeptide--D-alanyl-D-alanine ligase
MIQSQSVQRLFATGELAKHTVTAFGSNGQHFDTQEHLIQTLTNAISGKEIILVKGSRSQKMENVVAALVDNFRAN